MGLLENLAGKEVLVLGLARSGQAVALQLHRAGAHVTVNEIKEREACPEADELESEGIRVICGSHPDFLIHPNLAFIVKNPGIPYHIPPLVRAAQLGIDTITEVEVAYDALRSPLIAITGSNGKTTTTRLVEKIFVEAGQSPVVAGNIGTPLCEVAENADTEEWMVCELSSFQLKGTQTFSPKIACVLNITETHLDFHGTMEDYIESKSYIVQRQRPDDIAILNWDDIICRQFAKQTKANIFPFSMEKLLHYGVYIDQDRIIHKNKEGKAIRIIALSELGIPGRHNVQNALAATAIALAAGIEAGPISRALHNFSGVEHRLEKVRNHEGVVYYNDSKATNLLSTISAIASFTQPIILIAGGKNRKTDFGALIPVLKNQVKAVIAIGETAPALYDAAQAAGISKAEIIHTKDPLKVMKDAVIASQKYARAGEIVLLSPGCASWDMFESFEQRGSMFKQAVHNL